MFARLKSHLKQIKRDPAGQRFRNAHRRVSRSGATGGWAKVLCVALATLCIAIGAVLIFIPGPAFVFFILAGAFLASQWESAARALDKAEVKIRAVWGRLREKWRSRRPKG